LEIKDFIGKVVIDSSTGKRYVLSEITSPLLKVQVEQPDANGYRSGYCFPTINGDPISNGTLLFEDPTLTDPFKEAYNAYCRTEAAYYEEIGYWMRKD